MFTKLLKAEFRSTRGMLGLLCLIILGAAVLGGGAMRYLVWMSELETDMNLGIVLGILALIGAIISIAVCGVAALFLMIGRFYKSRYTDEGYLTFTLPVTTHQLLLSSLANSAIGMGIIFLTIFSCIMGMLLFGFSGLDGFWTTLQDGISRAFQIMEEALGSWKLGYLALTILNSLVSFACELIVLMLAVTIGALIAKKYKILAAVGIYYGIHLALSVVYTTFLVGTALAEYAEMISAAWMLGLQGLLSLVVAVGGYFLMHYLTDKKLNLP